MEFLNQYYLWVKAIHVMGFISWMAMLFYLPRLFVYHAENIGNLDYIKIVKNQEKKLYSFIGQPAMVVTVVTGVLMLGMQPQLFQSGGWLHIKLTFVLLLLIYHFICGGYVRSFGADKCHRSGKFFRMFNEIPTVCMVVIVICAVTKTF